MYVFISVALFSLIAFVLGSVSSQNIDLYKMYRTRTQKNDMFAIRDALDQYYSEKRDFPSSLTALTGTAGFEDVRSFQNSWMNYAYATSITDSKWRFNRAAAFLYDPLTGTSTTTYLATNTCGSQAFASAPNWCGINTSTWYRRETKEQYNEDLSIQRSRQQRMLQRFAAYYTKKQTFPTKDQSNANLVAGQSYSLATLSGYSGSASTCSGTYTYSGIPIDCGEMFSLWGGAVYLTYFSSTHIAFLTTTPVKNAAGTSIVVATDIDVS